MTKSLSTVRGQHTERVSHAGGGEVNDSWLVDRLQQLLALMHDGHGSLAPALDVLERRCGASVYSELIYLLSRLRFDPADAKAHWQRIVDHATLMERSLGDSIDPRVALVSYFTRVDRKLDNPMVIELELFRRTQAGAYRDELTGLYNYRYFEECLAHETLRCEHCGRPLSLIMIDVDHFKKYNDVHGHETGNQALTAIGRALKTMFAGWGIACRYGGEEFAIILPLTSKVDARSIAEQARTRIASERFPSAGGTQPEALTVSMGLATFPGDAADPAELVARADEALYEAKACGRNQLRLYAESGRSYPRADISLEGELRVLDEERRPIRTKTLSEGGLLLVTDRRLTVGSLVELSLGWNTNENRRLETVGRVVSVQARDDGDFEAAVRFTDIRSDDRRRLRRRTRGAG